MTPYEQLVQGLRDAAKVPRSVYLDLDDPQAWPAILTYAETIEADDPERAKELRHLVTCHQSGVSARWLDCGPRSPLSCAPPPKR